MKKLYLDPRMEVKTFKVENIVTESVGTVSYNEPDQGQYAKVTASWQTAGDILNFE